VAVQNQKYAVPDVLAGWLVQIFSLALYTAAGFVVLYRILGLLGIGRRFLLSLLSYFGTLMFVYATIGTGEMFTVPPLLFGVYHLLKARFVPQQDKAYLWAGFWYGLAFFVTNQVFLLIGVAAGVLLWSMRQWRPILLFLLPGLFFGLLTLGYNWLLFDHPLHFPQRYWIQGNPQVVLFELPNPGKLVDMLFLPWKGLFFYSPYLLLSLPGLRLIYRNLPAERRIRESVLLLIAGSFLVYFLFLFFNVGWSGGADFGFRYIVVVLPFLAIPAAAWLDKRPPGPLAWLLIIWSVAVCSFGALTDPEVPTTVPNPLLYNWPIFLDRATNNVPNLLLEQLFNVDNWLLRFSTSFLFLAALAVLLWRWRSVWQEEPNNEG
jgi:hypothetical protein